MSDTKIADKMRDRQRRRVTAGLVAVAVAFAAIGFSIYSQFHITQVAKQNRDAQCAEIGLWARALSYPPGHVQTAQQKAIVADFTQFLAVQAAPLHCPKGK